ncbi:hypothetical protein KFL_006420040 [Klebsormidium nitens]|uniref:Uncharacterized protein n=1 Tax=Klebsormidium nitens TaxID=105231 RepID=A0A1Y1IQP4_KLENI|nr:hypothetical protein KFL_006420040 [Klebsormidium nitens]|eukprot:GAQ90458.1 hypothetical protein KFL_006420040 [Klebsormidium nitens]
MAAREPHIALPHLGPELLKRIFFKVGPSPKDVATLAFVCKAWRDVLHEFTWEALCLEAAPALCEKAGFGGGKTPPGKWGWRGLYKLLTYCPGIQTPVPDDRDELKSPEDLCLFVGHVEAENQLGFLAGPRLKKDLRLKAACRKDTLFVTRPCDNPHLDKTDEFSEGFPSAARGLVKDFPNSAFARKSGAAAYLNQKLGQAEGTASDVGNAGTRKERRDGGMGTTCVYCDGQLFELPPEDFFDNDWRSEREGDDYEMDEDGNDDSGYNISGYVCESGHLILGVFGCLHFAGGFVKKIDGSGEDLDIDASDAVYVLLREFSLEASETLMKHLVWGTPSFADVMKLVEQELRLIAQKQKKRHGRKP